MSTLVLQFKQLSQNVLMPFLKALCPKCLLETSLGLASLLPCGLGAILVKRIVGDLKDPTTGHLSQDHTSQCSCGP